jgi:hypothetical protein
MKNMYRPYATDPMSANIWRAGDWAEVRPLAEILATLDERGALEAMPFMPEMAAYCGRRFPVLKVAHKTCDSSGWEYLRELKNAVHLNTQCDGSFHGGCQAMCPFFWKTAWLRKVEGPSLDQDNDTGSVATEGGLVRSCAQGVVKNCTYTKDETVDKFYYCQATEIKHATQLLMPWQISQYGRDLASRNVAPSIFLRYFVRAIFKAVKVRLNRALASLRSRWRGDAAPRKKSLVLEPVDLKCGDVVRIKPRHEIMATLNSDRKNFGLSFDTDMAQYCGTTHTVIQRVERIIDEKSGKMMNFSRDCYALQGVTCTGCDCRARLFCSRSLHTFWRGAWLEPVKDNANLKKTVLRGNERKKSMPSKSSEQ